MAIIPKQSIFNHGDIRPATFALWCVMCEVKNRNYEDVFLSVEKAAEAKIGKSAYYFGLSELESKGWIRLSKSEGSKKYWKLQKGFEAVPKLENSDDAQSAVEIPEEHTENKEVSTNAENYSTDADFPINTELLLDKIPQTRNENSTDADFFSTNAENYSTDAESHIRNTFFLPFVLLSLLQETEEKEKGTEAVPEKKTEPRRIPKTSIPENFELTEQMRIWAKEKVPELNVDDAHADFIEYWTNKDGKIGMKNDWNLTWQKGMRLQLKWQIEANQNGKFKPNQNGGNTNAITKQSGFETDTEKRERKARARIEFGNQADELLRQHGII